jgi:nitroreductase
MQTWDAIVSRRNVRRYDDRPIPGADLDKILEAGRRAPSASNRQPWDFVVCTDRGQLGRLSHVWQGASHVAASAATVVLVAPLAEDERHLGLIHYDLGQATMSMMLAATDLGVGSAHAAIGDQALAREILGVPEDRFCAYLVALGYPADRPLTPVSRPARRPFDEVVHREHW